MELTDRLGKSVDTVDESSLPGNVTQGFEVLIQTLRKMMGERDRAVSAVNGLQERNEQVDESLYETIGSLNNLCLKLGLVVKQARPEELVVPPPSPADSRDSGTGGEDRDGGPIEPQEPPGDDPSKSSDLGARPKEVRKKELKLVFPAKRVPDLTPKLTLRARPFFEDTPADSGLGEERGYRTSTPYPGSERSDQGRTASSSRVRGSEGDTLIYSPARSLSVRSLEVTSPRTGSGNREGEKKKFILGP